jgi:hypothetical protein
MRKQAKIFLAFCIISVFYSTVNAQKNTYNVRVINPKGDVKIKEPKNVFITNKIDSQIVYNSNSNTTNKIYVMGVSDLSDYVGTHIKKNTPDIMKMSFGNPDSLAMVDIDFYVEFSQPFDSAYFLNFVNNKKIFNPYDINSPIRNSDYTIFADKKKVHFRASYIKPKQLISLMIFRTPGYGVDSVSIKGAGKLW